MAGGCKIFLAVWVATIAAVYQLYIKHPLALAGIYPSRKIQSIGSGRCEAIKGIEACEKIVLHQPSGLLYMACSFTYKRRQWTPALDRLSPAGAGSDYFAQYDPKTKKVIRMKFADLEPNRYSSHGFDVVTSSTNSSELWFYVINHRVPDPDWRGARGEKEGKGAVDPAEVGADSVIQVFKGTSLQGQKGSSRMTWVKTYNSQHMHTPNDVVGSPDGKSFYWTNDHGSVVGKWRKWEVPLQLASSSVGYCHETEGCKLAATGLRSSNGIATSGNGTYYVASVQGYIQSFEAQKDNTFTLGDTIKLDRPIDNLAVAADGALYAGTYPDVFATLEQIDNPKARAPSSAHKITKNGGNGSFFGGNGSFFGEKYQVEKVFEDDGRKMGSISTAVVDTKRKLMYLHGIVSPQLFVCKL